NSDELGNGDFSLLAEAAAEVEALRAEVERYRTLEAEAAQFVEVPIINRTKFTGEEPYVGWRGLGLALNEALDERDALRAEVERLREALDDIRSRSLIDLVMRSDRLELIALLGDIYQIADSEL